MANENFHRRVGRISGGLDLLVSLGFREQEDGSLVLPIDAKLSEIEARRLELEVGLDLLKKRLRMMKKPHVMRSNQLTKSPIKQSQSAQFSAVSSGTSKDPPKQVLQVSEPSKLLPESPGAENKEPREISGELLKQHEADISRKVSFSAYSRLPSDLILTPDMNKT